jgi:hypothetical protein
MQGLTVLFNHVRERLAISDVEDPLARIGKLKTCRHMRHGQTLLHGLGLRLGPQESLMHRSEWTTCADTDPMFRLLQRRKQRPSGRKQRWFACACCRRVWASLDACCRRAVEVAERFADGAATREELNDAHDTALLHHRTRESKLNQLHRYARMRLDTKDPVIIAKQAWAAVEGACRPAQALPAKSTFHAAQVALLASGDAEAMAREMRCQADILRDLVGDPFARVASLDKSWLQWHDGTVARLARGIYKEQAFERMPVLGDALPEAGCRDESVLEHCRSNRPHHPGCWVLDLLLEQE